MDPDIFVHRPPMASGWVDEAVALMESSDSLAVLQAPWADKEVKSGCQVKGRYRDFSQRYFIFHRERLRRMLPVKVNCAPNCDTFETLFLIRAGHAGKMACSKESSWVIHPPDNRDAFVQLLRSCAPASMSLNLLAQSAPSRITLERAAREGLPRLLDRVATEPFGQKQLGNGGEDVATSLVGWRC